MDELYCNGISILMMRISKDEAEQSRGRGRGKKDGGDKDDDDDDDEKEDQKKDEAGFRVSGSNISRMWDGLSLSLSGTSAAKVE